MTENSKTPAKNYAEAIEELEEILSHMTENDVDVDDLAEKVKRGLELVKFCQGKIHKTEEQVQEMVDSISPNEEH